MRTHYKILTSILFVLLLGCTRAQAFSILAHEAIIDAEWDIGIKPLLVKKFGELTGPQFKEAHSYAYGGALMADMGYMPGGNSLFTDLLHYVRSGDLVMNLFNEAHTIDEYAFALGAMSHYMADKYGHSLATNRTVPLVYPKLRNKFGDVVTYGEDHTSHSRMEFTYDVLQVTEGSYASNAYHDFIGFNMNVPLLERAFRMTYGQNLNEYFKDINSSINTFRWGIRNLFPRLIKNAGKAHKNTIDQINPTPVAKVFRYRMKRHMFNLEYGKKKHIQSFTASLLATLVTILPKVGPLKSLKFIDPTPKGEQLFAESFKVIIQNYSAALTAAGNNQLNLPDINFDTGGTTSLGQYSITDQSYAKLITNLHQDNFAHLTPDLKQNILDFYKGASMPSFNNIEKKKDRKKAIAAYTALKEARPVTASLNQEDMANSK
ncbi:hypothetical protein GCM10027037_22370 [Mucilaginibacter koreensis]